MNLDTIKVGANARELQHFAGVYNALGWSRGFSYSGINVKADGTLSIDLLFPNVTPKEIADFMNKPVRILQKEHACGTYTVSVRGMCTIDVVIDPNIYPDDRISRISETKLSYAFLVDTCKNTVVAFRVFSLSDNVYKEIGRACTAMLENGYTSADITAGWENASLLSPKQLEQLSVYLGRDVANIKTEQLFLPFV